MHALHYYVAPCNVSTTRVYSICLQLWAIIEHSCTVFLNRVKFCRRLIISPARSSRAHQYAWKNSEILDQVEADTYTVAVQLLERELDHLLLDDDDRHADAISWLTLTIRHMPDGPHVHDLPEVQVRRQPLSHCQ